MSERRKPKKIEFKFPLEEAQKLLDAAEAQLDPQAKSYMAEQRRVIRERMDGFKQAEKAISAEEAEAIFETGCKQAGLTPEQMREQWQRLEELGPDAYRGGTGFIAPRQQDDTRRELSRRGVLEKHLEAVYDAEPDDRPAMQHVRWLLANRSTFLVMSSGKGTGKTGSACWALTQKPGYCVMAANLLGMKLSPAEDVRHRFDRLHRCQVLVIDELGNEPLDSKGQFFSMFENLINHRYGERAKTILTCNITAETFKERYGARIADRVRECGRFVEIAGESLRQREEGAIK